MRCVPGVELSALEHPNVIERAPIIPAAISHAAIDADVAGDCDDLGPYPEIEPEARHNDFVYALPPAHAAPDPAPRRDGHPGHRDGALRVWRPTDSAFAPRPQGGAQGGATLFGRPIAHPSIDPSEAA